MPAICSIEELFGDNGASGSGTDGALQSDAVQGQPPSRSATGEKLPLRLDRAITLHEMDEEEQDAQGVTGHPVYFQSQEAASASGRGGGGGGGAPWVPPSDAAATREVMQRAMAAASRGSSGVVQPARDESFAAGIGSGLLPPEMVTVGSNLMAAMHSAASSTASRSAAHRGVTGGRLEVSRLLAEQQNPGPKGSSLRGGDSATRSEAMPSAPIYRLKRGDEDGGLMDSRLISSSSAAAATAAAAEEGMHFFHAAVGKEQPRRILGAPTSLDFLQRGYHSEMPPSSAIRFSPPMVEGEADGGSIPLTGIMPSLACSREGSRGLSGSRKVSGVISRDASGSVRRASMLAALPAPGAHVQAELIMLAEAGSRSRSATGKLSAGGATASKVLRDHRAAAASGLGALSGRTEAGGSTGRTDSSPLSPFSLMTVDQVEPSRDSFYLHTSEGVVQR